MVFIELALYRLYTAGVCNRETTITPSPSMERLGSQLSTHDSQDALDRKATTESGRDLSFEDLAQREDSIEVGRQPQDRRAGGDMEFNPISRQAATGSI